MSEQTKSDVQLCCEALAAAQQVWLEGEQAQRATSSGQPSEVDELRQRVVELEEERDQGYMLVAWLNDDSPSGIDTQLVCRVLGLPYPDLEPLLALVADIEASGKALVEKRSKQ